MGTKFIAELIGTALLLFLGDSVVANVVLKKTNGNGSGWIVITFGWAMAVAVPAMIFGASSGAHFNPALTIALAVIGSTPWSDVPIYIIAQLIGAFIGAVLVWITNMEHFNATEDPGSKLGVFCTGGAIPNPAINFICEFLATFVLVFGILGIGQAGFAYGANFFGVGGIILVIGLCLGGTTGYAINPARDFMPRLAHAVLPIKGKGDSNWGYAWIPIVAPILGALFGALLANGLF